VFLRRDLDAVDDPCGRVRTGRRCVAKGEVRFFSTTIDQNLECDGADFSSSGATAISGGRLRVVGHVMLGYGFASDGDIDLRGARIDGNLDLDHATLHGGASGHALNVEAGHVGGSVLLRRDPYLLDDRRDRLRRQARPDVIGEIRLASCRIDENLECDGTQLSNPRKVALAGARLRVGGAVALRNCFSSDGEIDLSGAHIGGRLDADSCCLHAGESGRALNLDSAYVEGSVLLRRMWRRTKDYPDGRFCGPMCLVRGQLVLASCRIDQALSCVGVQFTTRRGDAIRGSRLRVGGDVQLLHCSTIGRVDLASAEIGGYLQCDGSTFEGDTGGSALQLNRAHIHGDVLLRRDWSTRDDRRGQLRTGLPVRVFGEIDVTNCTIGRTLSCVGSIFDNFAANAFNGSRAEIGSNLELTQARVKGSVQFGRARIGGELRANGAVINAGVGNTALDLGGARIEQNVSLRTETSTGDKRAGGNGTATGGTRFAALGEISLGSCTVGGDLTCDGALLANPGGFALRASWLEIEGNVHFRRGFSSWGAVQLNGLVVGKEFDCQTATFSAHPADVADATASPAARRGGRGRRWPNDENKAALDLSFARIESRARFDGSTLGTGWLRCYSLEVGADLTMAGVQLDSETSDGRGGGVDLRRSSVRGDFVWTGVDMQRSRSAQLLLDEANVAGRLIDDQKSWPAKGRLSLAGLRYGSIAVASRHAADRIRWLGLQKESTFNMQPYEQLASVLRTSGYEHAARRVAIARENALRRHEGMKLARVTGVDVASRKIVNAVRGSAVYRATTRAREAVTRFLLRPLRSRRDAYREGPSGMSVRAWLTSHLLRATIGYGYAASRTLIGVAFFVAFGWVVFGRAYAGNPCVFAPTDASMTGVPPAVGACVPGGVGYGPAKGHQTFNAFVYSLDAFLPIIDLHQKTLWLPDPTVRCAPKGWLAACGEWARAYLWLHIGAGWMLTTLAAAALTGLIRKT
jgi:hypothetical protein